MEGVDAVDDGTNCLRAFWIHGMNRTELLLTRLSRSGADVYEPASRPIGDSVCSNLTTFTVNYLGYAYLTCDSYPTL